MSLEATTADAVSSALLASPSPSSAIVSSADRSARISRPPPPAPPVTPERSGARKRSLEMLRTAGDSTLCDGPTADDEAAMGMVVTSSLEKTDDDVTSSALSLTTSEHDQGAGDFSSPPRPACPPAWMARLTWAPRIPKMPYSSLRVRFGGSDDDDHACPVPMKSRKIDRTPIHLEL
ncbi:hypothetical protein PRIPAC_70249 [Pristionchus pacificus]|uniref:Uncharacterized protein n=1 Tax=Pristionchus pacificus TaxID=54126 RepID=A0A2A6C6Z4_PRIPA|nr:hypothetical protein PRIPAC_70249 [Pristionchus pacificus]|eukprot:PDM73791.1 hypothetical protein PRIPAC_41147 [Pristionchus pacificus]